MSLLHLHSYFFHITRSPPSSSPSTTFLVSTRSSLLPRHHFTISPSLIFNLPLSASSTNNLSRHIYFPPSTFHDLDQLHPASIHQTIDHISSASNISQSSTTMGTAPRKQLASASHKRPRQPTLPKRTYKIPRSLKKAIKRKLVKIVKERERKIRDEEVSVVQVSLAKFHLSVAIFRST